MEIKQVKDVNQDESKAAKLLQNDNVQESPKK
jgi:hypothetical protein